MNNKHFSLGLLYGNELKLFFFGFLTLFLELILIRYLSGNIWNLGYFPNLVLIAAFIGMGIGFVFHDYVPQNYSVKLYQAATLCLFSLALLVHFKRPTVPGFGESEAIIGGELFFTSHPVQISEPSYALFYIWFFSVVLIFILISQRTAKLFALFAPLKSYTLNVAGSCCGILSFIIMSRMNTPAYMWFIFLIPLLIVTMGKMSRKVFIITLMPIMLTAVFVFLQDKTIFREQNPAQDFDIKWSPYQKVKYIKRGENDRRITVNEIGHQEMFSAEQINKSYYQIPYKLRAADSEATPYKNILIIGSGAGNDIAAALMNGVNHVDAVEIDPVIAAFGKKYHPLRPYDDPRVKLIIDDGRSFITGTKNKYDLIIFALTDSLIKVSPMAQLRLENYLFTKESILKTYNLLTDDGVLILYNHYRQQWLIDKISRLISEATGKSARIVDQWGTFVIFSVSRSDEKQEVHEIKKGKEIHTSTDDWPFLYLQKHKIPSVYIKAMIGLTSFIVFLMLLLYITSRKKEKDEKGIAPLLTKIAFVLMGVAFLLLETKSVVQFSLLFGTTWLNSSLVFLAVLLLVLAANLIANVIYSKYFLPIIYLLLIGSCFITLFYPVSRLLYYENDIVRFVLAGIMIFSPIFFANLIFSITFRGQKVAEHLFGWNLLGATIGGVLEYSSMAIGYNALTIIVAICYTGVFVFLAAAKRINNNSNMKKMEI